MNAMKAETGFSLKDSLFNAETVGRLAGWLHTADPSFDQTAFTKAALAEFPNLELKQRIAHLAALMAEQLPDAFPDAVQIILAALPEPLDPTLSDDDFGDFILAPFGHFIAERGVAEEHLDLSLQALRQTTMRFSAEDPIRAFINAFPQRTLAFLLECANDTNYHVRRLASEGTRPKLPWSGKLTIDHRDPLPILDALYADPTRYVIRSVANHLNDIAKIEPDLVVETLARWKKSGVQAPAEMEFLIQHATRTLVKQGNNDALALMGYGDAPQVTISDFETSTPTVAVGTAFEFSFTLTATTAQKLMVDYTMVFANTDGEPGGTKVFKLKRLETTAGEEVVIAKRHPMKLMTTRTLYEGTHTITLKVNGHELNSLTFELIS